MENTLQVDRKYKNRIGKIVTIVKQIDLALFLGDDGLEYGLVGVALSKGKSWDLVTQVNDGISKMLHALGISHVKSEYTQPNRRYSPYPKSYRNYYQNEDCEDWDKLVELGYAIKSESSLNLFYYSVTDEGKDYLRSIGYKWHEEKKRK